MGRLWWSVVLWAAAAGCHPSHRMLDQGNSYFEHCYAADSNPEVTDAQREACWSAWLAHYTRHQPAHRIDYALRRIEALQMGGMELSLEQAPAETPEEDPITSANSMKAYATKNEPVARGCATTCQQFRAECQARCDSSSDTDPCVESCEAYERTCLDGCY